MGRAQEARARPLEERERLPPLPAAVLRALAYLNPEMMVLGGAALSKDPSLRAAHAEKLANRPIFASPSQKRSELQASQAVLRGELTTPARKLGDAAGQARVVKAYSGKLGSRTGLAGGYAAPFPSDVPFEPLRITGRPRSEDPLGLSDLLSGVAGDALIYNSRRRAEAEALAREAPAARRRFDDLKRWLSGDDDEAAPRLRPPRIGPVERIVFADTTDREIDSWAELSFAERERLKRARDAKRDDLALAMRGTYFRGTNHPDWSKDEWTEAERPLGDYLGGGGEKDVYAFGDLVIGVRRAQGERGGAAAYERRLIRELKALKTLQGYGVRVAEARLVRFDGVPALLMKRYAGGSKEVFYPKTKQIDPYSRMGMLLNQNSIDDLRKLERLMKEKKFSINDLQFLIGADGHLFVADAIAVDPAQGPSNPNDKIIRALIARAKQNLR